MVTYPRWLASDILIYFDRIYSEHPKICVGAIGGAVRSAYTVVQCPALSVLIIICWENFQIGQVTVNKYKASCVLFYLLIAVVIFRRFDPCFRILEQSISLFLTSQALTAVRIVKEAHNARHQISIAHPPSALTHPALVYDRIMCTLCVNQIVPDGTVYTRRQRCLPEIVMVFFKGGVKGILEPLRV